MSMLIRPLSCVLDYVTGLNASLKQISSNSLTKSQCGWLVTVLMGLIVAGGFNWAAFARKSLGEFKESRLRWIFRNSRIAWGHLLQASVTLLIKYYKLNTGVLVLDDSDKVRSRSTSKIANVHKIKDKKTGGWFNGQEFIFLVLVTHLVTIPVGFRFYTPDPALRAWRKINKAEKNSGVLPRNRTKRPEPNPQYPSKKTLALELLKDFAQKHSEVKVQAILADALYNNAAFMDEAAKISSCPQVISQLRKNQLVRTCGKNISITSYFLRGSGVGSTLIIRGGEAKKVTMLAARLTVKAHAKKRFLIALKYDGETDYRFLVATDLTWRHKDIAQTYTLRWLVEVFIQDWKGHGGWNTLSKQQGVDSATQGLTLSLLCDHMLLLHPLQSARFKNKQPGMPVGCLIEHIKAAALIDGISHIVYSEEPKVEFDKFKYLMEESLPNRSSTKHLSGLDLGRIEPTPSLRYQKAA
jgi:hypothetical protein